MCVRGGSCAWKSLNYNTSPFDVAVSEVSDSYRFNFEVPGATGWQWLEDGGGASILHMQHPEEWF